MTTARDVFNLSMALMDELSDSGESAWADTREYENRTPSILNVLTGECYQYSDTYEAEEDGKRPYIMPLVSMEDYVSVDDVLARTVMPYGLAAHLLLDENPTAASFFQQRYDELLRRVGKNIPSSFEPITDVYGGCGMGIEHSQYGRW